MQQQGFSLLELLIALLIMSVGVLGMVGLQTLSMQQNRSALLQGDATLLINDLLDRISSNSSVNYAGLAITATPAPASSCIDHHCTREQLKDFDLTEWQCSINSTTASGGQYPACERLGVRGRLPGAPCASLDDACAGGEVTRSGDVYAVSVQWVEQQAAHQGGDGSRRVSLQMKANGR